jgi:hypothetical protein
MLRPVSFLDWINLRHLPPVLRRRTVYYAVATLVFAATTLACVWVFRDLRLRYTWLPRTLPLLLGLTPTVLFMPIMMWHQRRLRRRFHAAGGRLCTHCAYDLSTLGPHGTCPECGNTFDTEKDELLWLAAKMRISRI